MSYQTGLAVIMGAQTTLRNLPIGIQNFVTDVRTGNTEEALAQISDKNYTLPFAVEDQQIIRLGINFDSQTRNIDKVLVG